MSTTEKLAELKSKHRQQKKRRPWWKRSIGNLKAALFGHDPVLNERHHPCAARGTASKNTDRNRWNIRGRKGIRVSGHHAKHYAFKHRFGL